MSGIGIDKMELTHVWFGLSIDICTFIATLIILSQKIDKIQKYTLFSIQLVINLSKFSIIQRQNSINITLLTNFYLPFIIKTY